MLKDILLLLTAVNLIQATKQSVDNITVPAPVSNQESPLHQEKSLTTQNTVNRKEKLLDVVKIINSLLSDDVDSKQYDNVLEEVKEINDLIKPGENVEQSLKNSSKNKTEDYSKILEKISAALANLEDETATLEYQNPSDFLGMFRTNHNDYIHNLNPPLFDNLGQTPKQQSKRGNLNAITSADRKFNIPCQRAADILKETPNIAIPKNAYCNMPKNINSKSIIGDPKLNSNNMSFKSYIDSEDSVAVLFKPKKVSITEVYGNLLKKITKTVLVPYHVSKLCF